MKTIKDYAKMQIDLYNTHAGYWSLDNRDPVVGSFDAHNTWADYDEFLFKDVPTENRHALDFGCGPGRNIVKFNPNFGMIDGIDLSPVNIEKARLWINSNIKDYLGNLYVSNGLDLQPIPNDTYDVVFSTICMQHICVHEIRFNILKDMFRVLKPSGHLCLQMGYGTPNPSRKNSVPYFANYVEASSSNGGMDVRIEKVEDLESDLTKIGFTEFKYWIRPTGPGDAHPNWIFFQVKKP